MRLKHISWLPAALLMISIFAFSSKPAETSNESSLTIANKIFTAYETLTNTSYEGTDRLNILEKINHIVRKGAHFSEYAFLACTIAFHFMVLRKSKKWLFIDTIILSFLYAVSDEYHQTFVVGRAGRFTDVLIDTTGAVTGVLLFLIIVVSRVYHGRNEVTEQKR